MTLHGVLGGTEVGSRQVTQEADEGPHPGPEAEMNYRVSSNLGPKVQDDKFGAETSHGVFVH